MMTEADQKHFQGAGRDAAGRPDHAGMPAIRGADGDDGASWRIRRDFVVLAALTELVFLIQRHWLIGAGFAAGALVAYYMMSELERGVAHFAAGAANTQGKQPNSAALVARYALRYAVAGAAGYGIFRSSRAAFWGFAGALFLPVAAMMCEAGYEAWLAIRANNS